MIVLRKYRSIRDDAVLERTHREDPLGGPAEHPLGLEADALDLAGALLDGDDRRLIEHDALAFDVDEGIRRAQVHRDLVRGEPGREVQ
jgi:hypothetical protein